jgi:hypothetical protein
MSAFITFYMGYSSFQCRAEVLQSPPIKSLMFLSGPRHVALPRGITNLALIPFVTSQGKR